MLVGPSYRTLAVVLGISAELLLFACTPVEAIPSTTMMKEKRSEPMSFPIHRRTPFKLAKRSRSLEQLRGIREHDLARQNFLLSQLSGMAKDGDGPDTAKKRAGWETLAMSSFNQDSFYYTTIQMGMPAQEAGEYWIWSWMSGITDPHALASDLWVQSTTCRSCNLSLAEPYYDGSKNAFDSTASSTYQGSANTVQLSYGDGSALVGNIAQDTVSVGQFSVPGQTFILATQESTNFGTAGLLGLAWPSLAQSRGTPWWLSALSQFAQPEMSFYFAEWNSPPSNDAAPGGQFTLGGRNTSLFIGDIGFVPLSSQDYWTVPLQSLVVHDSGNRTLSLNGAYASGIVDTGTTLIYGPSDVVDSLFQGVNGAVRGGTISRQLQGYWAVPCSSTTSVTMQFTSAVSVVIPAANLMFESIDVFKPGYCTASISSSTSISPMRKRLPSSSNTPAWVLGDVLLKSTYTVFRKGNSGEQPSVGFAPLSGVNYGADGNAIIGANGDGTDGRIGQAGVTVVGSGDGGGSGTGGTASQGSGTSTATSGGGTNTGTNAGQRRAQLGNGSFLPTFWVMELSILFGAVLWFS